MLRCPACHEPGITAAARLTLHLRESVVCRRCGIALAAHGSLRLVLLLVFLGFVILGLAVLPYSRMGLGAVVAAYVALRIGLSMAFPIAIAADRGRP